jgi:hypothetical protein
VGIPWTKVETMGFMLYLGQPVFLASGEFTQAGVSAKLLELGFKQEENGFFDYIYSGQKLHVAADGLMIMADPMVLGDLRDVPEEHRLWNRPDFKKYRETSPLDNSLFVWSHPPDNLLSGFKYRDALGDVSLAATFRTNFNMRATVRLKEPEKTVALYNILFGTITVGKGFFGDDPELGPVVNAIKVSQDNSEVSMSLVVSADNMGKIKDRLRREFEGEEQGTFAKIESFLKSFR